MKTYDYAGPDPHAVRSHPWTVAAENPAARYLDLRADPALIRTSLEDFLPWSDWPAVDTFYSLLEWLNGAGSTLESNDCAFVGPSENPTDGVPKALEATGRLMILWRKLPLNLSRENVEWLRIALHRSLNETDPGLEYGVVGISVCRVRFVRLPVSGRKNLGLQLMLSFWAWGDTDEEVMANLARVFRNLWDALRAAVTDAEGVIGRRPRGG
jgi:hypothetical protein